MMVLHDSFGVKFIDTVQEIGDFTVYDSTVIASPITKNENSIAIHWYDQTWVENTTLFSRLRKIIKSKFPKINRMLYNLVGR